LGLLPSSNVLTKVEKLIELLESLPRASDVQEAST